MEDSAINPHDLERLHTSTSLLCGGGFLSDCIKEFIPKSWVTSLAMIQQAQRVNPN